MPGPTTEVVSSDPKELGRKVDELARELRDLTVAEAETRTTVGNARWIISLLLAGILALVGTSLYRAGEPASQVRSIDTRLDKLEARVDTRLDKLETKVDAILKMTLDRLNTPAQSPGAPTKP